MPSVQENVLIVGGGLAAQVAVVIGDGPDDLVLEAARACPAMAIEVVDADTGALVET